MHKSHGFTLIELMVVLTIVAILSAIAAPSLKRMIQSTTISGNVNTFLADMRYARSESIRRGGGVVMCRSDAPEAANPTCDSSNDTKASGWVSGWIIFHALERDDVQASSETLLRVQSPITSIDSIATTVSKFRFTATGRSSSSAGSLVFGGGNYAADIRRRVCISSSGRPRIASNSDEC